MRSQAGPWKEGREERREKWLKGEADLALPSPWDEKSAVGTVDAIVRVEAVVSVEV